MANPKLIKELRARTGAGFLDVKKALEAAEDDLDKAIIWLQERGAAKAAKKAGAIAAEGAVKTLVKNNEAVIYEVNAQTDFVANNKQFQDLVTKIGNALINNNFKNIAEAQQLLIEGKSIALLCQEATATIGEKIELRRAQKINGPVIGAYTHVNSRVAAIVIIDGGNEEVARNVAMHVASMNPQYLDKNHVPQDILAKMEAEIAQSEVLAKKPEKIRANIAQGMLRKQLSEITLVDQEFVMEKMSVAKYLDSFEAKAKQMVRFELGEGIEKVVVDFAAEVAAQMNS